MPISPSELIVVAALALLLFGAKRIPELMRGFGQGIREFKKGMNEPEPTRHDGAATARAEGRSHNACD